MAMETVNLIVTDHGYVTPRKWGQRIMSEVRLTSTGWPDRRYKKGKIAHRYFLRVLKYSERQWLSHDYDSRIGA